MLNSNVFQIINLSMHPNILQHNNNRSLLHNIRRKSYNIHLQIVFVVVGRTLVVAVGSILVVDPVVGILVVGLVGSSYLVVEDLAGSIDWTAVLVSYGKRERKKGIKQTAAKVAHRSKHGTLYIPPLTELQYNNLAYAISWWFLMA